MRGVNIIATIIALLVQDAFATPKDEKFHCSIEKDGVMHEVFLTIKNGDGAILDYRSLTKTEAGKNNCRLQGMGAVRSAMWRTIAIPLQDEDVVTIFRCGDLLTLHFKITKRWNYCGHASEIAENITLRREWSACVSVDEN